MKNVVLLIKPNINVQAIINMAHHMGNTINSDCVSPDAKSVSLMCKVFKPGIDDVGALRTANGLLRHFTYGFAFVTDLALEFLSETRLNSTVQYIGEREHFVLVSGTLEDWRNSLINCNSLRVSKEVRVIMNHFLDQFDKLGLTQLFAKYSRKKHSDGTLLLEHKPQC